jgi:hypothetical protein
MIIAIAIWKAPELLNAVDRLVKTLDKINRDRRARKREPGK